MGGISGGTMRYSVPEAARHLGISERAIRKRIEKGSLEAEMVAGHWVVTLAAPVGGTTAATGGTDGIGGGTDVAHEIAHLQAMLTEVRGERDRQQATIVALTAAIERGDRERTELRQLLAHSVASLPERTATPPPAPVDAPAPAHAPEHHHDGWGARVWRWLAGDSPSEATGN